MANSSSAPIIAPIDVCLQPYVSVLNSLIEQQSQSQSQSQSQTQSQSQSQLQSQTQSQTAEHPTSVYLGAVTNALIGIVRAIQTLPHADDWQYYMLQPKFAEHGAHTDALLRTTLEHVNRVSGARSLPAIEQQRADENALYKAVHDAVEQQLERVDLLLDEEAQRRRRMNGEEDGIDGLATSMLVNLQSEGSVATPVGAVVDNSVETPWVPILTRKPHAVVDNLQEYEGLRRDVAAKKPLSEQQMRLLSISPYAPEISTFTHSKESTSIVAERGPTDIKASNANWIDTPEKLTDLAVKLQHVSEFAADLEHHNFYSYQGFTCLMQLSTRNEDFLIDTLALRLHMHMLLPAFSNPNIVKVLHGSDSDVLWLQRDFGLYIVNLFDTGQASRVLEMRSFGLAHLLEHYCNVQTNKKFQLSDWRQRPLPPDMLLYARMDTHYLLYIYDRMRNELIEQSSSKEQQSGTPSLLDAQQRTIPHLLGDVLFRSRAVAMRVYKKEPVPDKLYAVRLSRKFDLKSSLTQLRSMLLLMQWRDRVARHDDVSPMFIMGNQSLLAIAHAKPVPKDPQQLLACHHPMSSTVKKNIRELVQILAEAQTSTIDVSVDDSELDENVQRKRAERAHASQQLYAAVQLPNISKSESTIVEVSEHTFDNKAEPATKIVDLTFSDDLGTSMPNEFEQTAQIEVSLTGLHDMQDDLFPRLLARNEQCFQKLSAVKPFSRAFHTFDKQIRQDAFKVNSISGADSLTQKLAAVVRCRNTSNQFMYLPAVQAISPLVQDAVAKLIIASDAAEAASISKHDETSSKRSMSIDEHASADAFLATVGDSAATPLPTPLRDLNQSERRSSKRSKFDDASSNANFDRSTVNQPTADDLIRRHAMSISSKGAEASRNPAPSTTSVPFDYSQSSIPRVPLNDSDTFNPYHDAAGTHQPSARVKRASTGLKARGFTVLAHSSGQQPRRRR